MASARDLILDGYDDLLIDARGYNTANPNAGKAYSSLGDPGGPALSRVWTAVSDDVTDAQFGLVSSAEDVDGDGRPEVLVGLFLLDFIGTDIGKAFMYCVEL